MAHFRATIKGNRGLVSRLGTKAGLVATINGWNIGVNVVASHDPLTGRDHIHIYQSGGSNSPHNKTLLATIATESKATITSRRLKCSKHGGNG